MQPGDAYILRSGGGGGYGSPLERDLDALERDVRCGYVSRKRSAEENYGAVFKGDTLEIDVAATKAKREEMRAKGLPYDNPIAETLIPFAAPPAPERNPEHEKLTPDERVAFAMQCRCCT